MSEALQLHCVVCAEDCNTNDISVALEWIEKHGPGLCDVADE